MVARVESNAKQKTERQQRCGKKTLNRRLDGFKYNDTVEKKINPSDDGSSIHPVSMSYSHSSSFCFH